MRLGLGMRGQATAPCGDRAGPGAIDRQREDRARVVICPVRPARRRHRLRSAGRAAGHGRADRPGAAPVVDTWSAHDPGSSSRSAIGLAARR